MSREFECAGALEKLYIKTEAEGEAQGNGSLVMMEISRIAILAALLLAAVSPSPAKADRIDGNWCRGLKFLSIDGPKIVTAGGTKMTGEYDRHGFQYVVPNGEPDAGATITMAQMHDELMRLSSSARPGEEAEDWIRCKRQIS